MMKVRKIAVFIVICLLLTGCGKRVIQEDEASFDTQKVTVYVAGGSERAEKNSTTNAVKVMEITDTKILAKLVNKSMDCVYDAVEPKEQQSGVYRYFLRFNDETVVGIYPYIKDDLKTNDYGYVSDKIEQNAKPVWLPVGMAEYVTVLLEKNYNSFTPQVKSILKSYGISK